MNDEVRRDYERYKNEGRIWGQVTADRIRKISFERIKPEIVARYNALADLTTTISDILDDLGVIAAVSSVRIRPMIAGTRLVGPVVTLRNIPERKSPARASIDGDKSRLSTRDIYYIGEKGDVLVADFGGNPDVSNLGGQSMTAAHTAGFAGVIANGAVRDVATIRRLSFPVWAMGATPITGKYRAETIELNGPVTVHDVVVEAGDLALADDDGLCFVPAHLAEEVLRRAEAVTNREKTISERTTAGASVDVLQGLFTTKDS